MALPPLDVLLQAMLAVLLGLAQGYVGLTAARRQLLQQPGVLAVLLGAMLLACGAALGAFGGYAGWAGSASAGAVAAAGTAALASYAAGAFFLLLGFKALVPHLHTLARAADELRAHNEALGKAAQDAAERVWRSNETVQRVVEERDRIETTLLGFGEQWRSLVENAPSVILGVDREGKIVFSNRPGTEFALGTSFFRWIPPENLKMAREMLQRVFASGEAGSYEICYAAPDQEKAWYAMRIGPVKRDNAVAQATIIATDITEWKRAEEAKELAETRQREIERLQELEKFKTQLLHTTAHELSNPLAPVKTHLFLLAKSGALAKLDDRQKQSFQVVERNFQRIQMLVSDMRDLTRVQNGKLNLQWGPVDVGGLLLDAAQSFEEPARGAGVSVVPMPVTGLLIEADGQRLMQVLFNLVKNSIKFTPSGGTVSLEAAVEQDHALIRVRDTGKGMTAEQIAKLFQPFSQVHVPGEQPSEQQEKGTGLGLYISKGIVEAHGGSMWVESEGPGKGATFSFALPLQRPAAPAMSAQAAQAGQPAQMPPAG
ncbi:MAG TPA: PAS domain-containing sensor histidine kinase [Candidatus Thermoplasmatota archaeon]|jgi:hypothetical protein|nr:PAS domain-containing sensor histidine kinase [Candidatus Thermoplasmatota archaeon]